MESTMYKKSKLYTDIYTRSVGHTRAVTKLMHHTTPSGSLSHRPLCKRASYKFVGPSDKSGRQTVSKLFQPINAWLLFMISTQVPKHILDIGSVCPVVQISAAHRPPPIASLVHAWLLRVPITLHTGQLCDWCGGMEQLWLHLPGGSSRRLLLRQRGGTAGGREGWSVEFLQNHVLASLDVLRWAGDGELAVDVPRPYLVVARHMHEGPSGLLDRAEDNARLSDNLANKLIGYLDLHFQCGSLRSCCCGRRRIRVLIVAGRRGVVLVGCSRSPCRLGSGEWIVSTGSGLGQVAAGAQVRGRGCV
eukprot:Colp12_sorted_trinity150504_noHs@25296